MVDKLLFFLGDLEICATFCVFMLLQLSPKKNDVSRIRSVSAIAIAIAVVFLNLVLVLRLTETQYLTLYTFVFVIPIFFCFVLISRYSFFKVLFVGFSSLIFNTPGSYLLRLISFYLGDSIVMRLIVRAVFCVIIAFIMKKTVCKPLKYMLDYTEKGFGLICAAYAVWYIAFFFSRNEYITGNGEADAGWMVALPIIVMGILFYLLLIFRFRTTREETLLKAELDTAQIQITAAMAQTEQIRDAQAQLAVLRHDMKHHAAIIDGLIQQGENEKAHEYIARLNHDISETAVERYCQNETINLVLAHYLEKAKKAQISVQTEIDIPNELTADDADLAIIFANIIDNAIHALATEIEKELFIKAYAENGRLFAEVKNSFTGQVQFLNHLPVTTEKGHGYGAKSVALIVERYKGQYYFGVENGYFVFRCGV